MTKKEFCDRIGVHCSDACFEKYNERYMESELDKDEFCKKIKPRDIIWEMQWEIIELKKQLASMTEQYEDMRDQRNEYCGKFKSTRDENLDLKLTLERIKALINA